MPRKARKARKELSLTDVAMFWWEGEDDTKFYKTTHKDLARMRWLLEEAEDGEFPEEVNTIIDRATEIPVPTVSTTGDNWGWYE